MFAVAAAAALTIATASPVAAVPHVDSSAANFDLTGTAAPGTVVDVTVKCAQDKCRERTTAGVEGNWKIPLNLVLKRGQRAVTIRVDTRQESTSSRLKLRYPSWAQAAPYTKVGRAPSMAVIGDSLAVGSAKTLRETLPDWKVTTDARFGRPLGTGMEILEHTPLPFHPIALAFSLFSNDDPAHLQQLDAAVRLTIDRLGPSDCAIWSTIVRPPQDSVPYDYANGLLMALANEFSDRMILVDWAAAIRLHPEWLGPDQTHPTVQGYRERARLYAQAAELCRAMKGW